MAKAGEPTSCPVGTRVDRKTLNLTLESLEMAGRIKLLTASVPLSVGPTRTAKIAYLPAVSDEELENYLASLGTSGGDQSLAGSNISNKGGDEHFADVGHPQSLAQQWYNRYESKAMRLARWHKNLGRSQELLRLPSDAIQKRC